MKRTFAFIFCTVLFFSAFAQSPESMTYQAVVRDAVGNILPNQPVAFKFSILNLGIVEYLEVHYTSTNNFGLVNITIGQGNVLNGNFSLLDWKNNQYDLKIELDENGGATYTDMGTVPFHSVPYALHAKTADNVDDADADPTNELQDISLLGNDLSISNGSTIDLTTLNTDNQTLSVSGNELSISDGNTVILSDNVDDADSDPTNEIELPATAVVGQIITWDGSSWVAQNSGSGSDNWGTQVAQTNFTISGDGTSSSPLGLASQGASSGESLKWDGLAWVPSTDNVDDADNDPTNEIELPASAIVGQVITWDGSSWVAQNSGSGSDNWGTQV
ncbi:MAG: hypothetical protein JXR36_06555, partial [Bacteroidales bacterium]|nr:hypothetical protein [Bacteroidales bacterium]